MQGARVESRTQFQAVIVSGRPVNHILHAILTFFTCFAWGLVWLIISGTGGEQRQAVEVDPWGRLVWSGWGPRR